jgi:hypothetical protein
MRRSTSARSRFFTVAAETRSTTMSCGVVLKRTATLAADRDAATAARKLSFGNALRDKFDAGGMISKCQSFGHCPAATYGLNEAFGVGQPKRRLRRPRMHSQSTPGDGRQPQSRACPRPQNLILVLACPAATCWLPH